MNATLYVKHIDGTYSEAQGPAGDGRMEPTYYVKHIDGSYTEAACN